MQNRTVNDQARDLALPLCKELSLKLWDVEFKKEGGTWFLRLLIDKEGGVGIDDCERFSREIEPLLDQADFIENSYCLEVSSPGIDRVLKNPEHFELYMGHRVEVKFFKPQNGEKVIDGILSSFDGLDVTIERTGEKITFPLSHAAYVRLYVEW